MKWMLKICQVFCHCSTKYKITDRDASLRCIKITQAAMKLKLKAPSYLHHRKMPSRYFEGNAQPEHHSNFDCQVNIVEDFNFQLDYPLQWIWVQLEGSNVK